MGNEEKEVRDGRGGKRQEEEAMSESLANLLPMITTQLPL